MAWENIKLAGIMGSIFGTFAYAYGRIALLPLIIAAFLLIVGFINCVEVRQ